MTVLLHHAAYGDVLQSFGAGIAVWDTARPSAEPLAAAAFAGKGQWTRIPRDQKAASFKGDAVLTAGDVLAVLRKLDSAVEVYSVGPRGVVSRVRLRLLSPTGEPAARLDRVALVENTRSAARLEASYQTKQGDVLTARLRIKRGDVSVELEPSPGVGRLRVDCPGRFVVLPDFFADDIVIDARKVPVPHVEVPSENFLLQPTAGGDAIVMCVFENREQDVRLSLAGKGDKRIVTGSEIDFGQDRKIWVALMEAPQVWHAAAVSAEQAKKVTPLEWKMPFAAQWRIDFTRTNDLTDSWEMLLEEKQGRGYLKPAWMGRGASRIGPDRKRWTTVLGRFVYPCWIDRVGRGYIQPLKHRALTFEGPALIYPINRLPQTPTDTFTVVDIVRNSLGVGPCEYILKVEGQKQEKMGRATCAARDALQAIYRNNQQRQKRREIEAVLDDALAFVTHIRGRITRYVEFGHETQAYLAEQRKAHPELAEFLTEMDKITREIDARIGRRQEKIKTPEFVAEMNGSFRKDLLDYEGPDVLDRLKKYTGALTQIGGNQDELVGECRWVVRTLRQRAGIMMAVDPRCAEIAQEIRARTQQVLLKPATYEAARH